MMNWKRSWIIFIAFLLLFNWAFIPCFYVDAEPDAAITSQQNKSIDEVDEKNKIPFEGLVSDPDWQEDHEEEKEMTEEEKQFYVDIDNIVKKHLGNFVKNGGKGIIGIYIKELKTGYEYDYNGSKLSNEYEGEGFFQTASTCKMAAAAAVYYLNNIGELDIDREYTDEVTGTKYNMKKLTYKMITHSVNEYFNTLLRHFGNVKLNEVFQELGLKNTYVYSEIGPAAAMSYKSNIERYGISRGPRTTPKDLGRILDLLYEGKAFGEANSKYFDESLRNNIYSNRLPQGIGYRSPVAHKTGTNSYGVYNDAGIIYLEGNPYIMVVMSLGSQSSVQVTYRAMAKEIYEYMIKRIKTE
ncbi:serine hydrolase [Lutispora thermophila]|uniref:Beta-lactamase class A n=1 Tax=Lutispora thermophila DSM 19022 TaxID=1122184 RepID=A0A1M6GCM0_9FIRM|nr:serine hydrolase [Lutispora thermophila]SHJ07660.1 Beta-lactamase class A [Lutispora thermophila DSM 19022]